MDSKSSRPKISIPFTEWHKVLAGCTVLACVFMVVYLLYCYEALPEQVATNFSRSGIPTSYSGKASLLTTPAVGLIICLTLLYLARFPHLFNYGFAMINESNAREYYRLGVTLVLLTAAYASVLLGYETFHIISTAMASGEVPRDTTYQGYHIGGIAVVLGWYIYAASKIE